MDKLEYLKSLGYNLLSVEGSYVKVECKNKHVFRRAFASFKIRNTPCPECEIENRKQFLDNINYSLISINGRKVEVKCKTCNTIFSKEYCNFKQGKITCNYCETNNKIEYIQLLGYNIVDFESRGYVKIQCKHNHIFSRAYNSLKNGFISCPYCEHEQRETFFKLINLELITFDKGKITAKCKKNHIFNRTYGSFKRGSTLCPICYPKSSSFEKEVKNILPKNVIVNNRTVLDGKELDFYLPEYNLAIECNGDYWHSKQMGKDKSYHLEKSLKCINKGIYLIHIFESKWRSNKQFYIDLIKNHINGTIKRYPNKVISDISCENQLIFPKLGYKLVDNVEPNFEIFQNTLKVYNCGYNVWVKSF
ncbi:homing endonuclease [Campylobacter phage CP30A]|uniref:Putative Hef-like homing endonuclease n=1 Tax=Campylobacter phage CP30A TaxID=1229752 RepID=J9SWD1_9CAUD|nr:homing endonuclease [Campylobacter phage CP30A]AFR52383.1 putative Hef-like homing endonuclease [Campylobacter phage CP30A]